jgi:hypothetical protein
METVVARHGDVRELLSLERRALKIKLVAKWSRFNKTNLDMIKHHASFTRFRRFEVALAFVGK